MVTTKSMVRKLTATLLLLLLSTSFSACYTLFRHPRLAQLNYQRPNDKSCVKCHSHADLKGLVSPNQLKLANAPWDEFYDAPWWFNDRHGAAADTSAANTDTDDTPEPNTSPHVEMTPSQESVDGESTEENNSAKR